MLNLSAYSVGEECYSVALEVVAYSACETQRDILRKLGRDRVVGSKYILEVCRRDPHPDSHDYHLSGVC